MIRPSSSGSPSGEIVEYKPRETRMAWRFKAVKRDVFEALCDPRFNLSNQEYLIVLNVYRSQREVTLENGRTDLGAGVSAYAIAKLVKRDYSNVKLAIISLVERGILMRDGDTLRVNAECDQWRAGETGSKKRSGGKPKPPMGVSGTPMGVSETPLKQGFTEPPGGLRNPQNRGATNPYVGVSHTPVGDGNPAPDEEHSPPIDHEIRTMRSINKENTDLSEEVSGEGCPPDTREAAVNDAVAAFAAGGYQIAGVATLAFRGQVEKLLAKNVTDYGDPEYLRRFVIPAIEGIPGNYRAAYPDWIDQLHFCLSKSRGAGFYVDIWTKKKPGMSAVSEFDGFEGSRVVDLAALMDAD